MFVYTVTLILLWYSYVLCIYQHLNVAGLVNPKNTLLWKAVSSADGERGASPMVAAHTHIATSQLEWPKWPISGCLLCTTEPQ